MKTINVSTRDQVGEPFQQIFDAGNPAHLHQLRIFPHPDTGGFSCGRKDLTT